MGGEVPVKKGILNQERVKETITLSASQIDSLTHILYNISYQGPFFTILEGLCYSPRNAILFNNSKGKTFAFIEVCFQCIGNRLSSKKVKDGDFCDEKYELLRNYFRNAGVLFGTEKRIYSDEE
jgi:hypothetical protein